MKTTSNLDMTAELHAKSSLVGSLSVKKSSFKAGAEWQYEQIHAYIKQKLNEHKKSLKNAESPIIEAMFKGAVDTYDSLLWNLEHGLDKTLSYEQADNA